MGRDDNFLPEKGGAGSNLVSHVKPIADSYTDSQKTKKGHGHSRIGMITINESLMQPNLSKPLHTSEFLGTVSKLILRIVEK